MSEQEEQQYVETDEYYQPEEETSPKRGLFQSLMVRITLGLVVLIVVIAVVGAIVFFSIRSSRNKPLNVKVYPGAALVGSQKLNDGFGHHDRTLYSVTAALEDIEKFYTKQKGMSCRPYFGKVVDNAGNETQTEGHVYTNCEVDHSLSRLGITQYTTILIQPDYDASLNPTGKVFIQIERFWGS